MDSIYNKEEKYLVVEGNRRVAALKLLTEEHKKGNTTLAENISGGMEEFEALVYDGDKAAIAKAVKRVGCVS